MMMKNKVFDALDKTFQTAKTETQEVKLPAIKDDSGNKIETDFEEARQALKRSQGYNEEAIQGILAIAQNSDNPRAYEVAGQLIKNMSEGAKDAMEIQDKKQRIDKVFNPDQGPVTNNNLFVGSTSELLKMLNKDTEEEKNIIEHD